MSGPQHVYTPARHDGIGTALRTAFGPRTSEVPNDLVILIEKLR